ncbi:MAG: hypothetical protein H8E34_08310 [Bacteroidetes bacterium]|nr:hypothetical protein [Bacteroidota bacterium]MBL6944474.1 hypothetical protein [Bacteroidales bacterium]
MEFKKAAILGSYMSKDYAEPLFKLLVNYSSISASEAASRLNLHIRTVQDFLEAMTELNILKKEEVYEKKRPYNRYVLLKHLIKMEINLDKLQENDSDINNYSIKIRERNNSGAQFTTARNGQYFSNVAIWVGKGREGKERKISLTETQGRFLFNLPFPNSAFMDIIQIMKKAHIDTEHSSEISDIVNLLKEYGVVETEK